MKPKESTPGNNANSKINSNIQHDNSNKREEDNNIVEQDYASDNNCIKPNNISSVQSDPFENTKSVDTYLL